MSWEMKKLEDLCVFTRGLTYSKRDEVENSNNRVLRATNIDLETHTLKLDEIRFINDKVRVKQEKKVRQNDILICTASGSKSHLGKVVLVDSPIDFAFGGFMAVIRTNEEILPQYLFKNLISQNFKNHIARLNDGTNINNLKFDQIRDFQIPTPPLPVQKQIVEKLDAAFADIDKAHVATQKNIENAEALFQKSLTNIFCESGKHWLIDKLENLLEIKSGDFLPAKNMNKNGNIDVYGGNGISGNHDGANLNGQNIIIGRVGAKCGNTRLVEGKIWVTDNAFYVKNHHQHLYKPFLQIKLELLNLRQYAKHTAQPVISFKTIRDAKISYPESQREQKKLVNKKSELEVSINKLIHTYSKKLTSLENLKSSILNRAFSGELTKDAA